jgi:hypothetical protein
MSKLKYSAIKKKKDRGNKRWEGEKKKKRREKDKTVKGKK